MINLNQWLIVLFLAEFALLDEKIFRDVLIEVRVASTFCKLYAISRHRDLNISSPLPEWVIDAFSGTYTKKTAWIEEIIPHTDVTWYTLKQVKR